MTIQDKTPNTLTAAGLARVQDELGLNPGEMARVLECDVRAYRRMISEQQVITPSVARLVRALHEGFRPSSYPEHMDFEGMCDALDELGVDVGDFQNLLEISDEHFDVWRNRARIPGFAVTAIRWLEDGWEPKELRR